MIIEEFEAALHECIIEGIAAGFTKPDDDWPATLLFDPSRTPEPINVDVQVDTLGITPATAFMADDKGRMLMCEVVLPQLAVMFRPRHLALVTSGRELAVDFDKRPAGEPLPSVEDHPDSYEVLIIEMIGRGYFRHMSARVYRDGVHPPRLGEFKVDTSGKWNGQIIRAMRSAIASTAINEN